VLEALALRRACLKLNRMTLTPPTTSHVNVGSVPALNRGNNMACGKSTSKKGSKMPIRGQRAVKNKASAAKKKTK
jgi:hypothetical protein